jgi:hypothetical protein
MNNFGNRVEALGKIVEVGGDVTAHVIDQEHSWLESIPSAQLASAGIAVATGSLFSGLRVNEQWEQGSFAAIEPAEASLIA